MSEFYGNLKGARGEATRCGNASSGIKAAVRSWSGSVITTMWKNGGKLMVGVSTSDHSDGTGQTEFSGTFEELKDLFELKRSIESGEASIVRHRKAKKAR